jgi:hypothetical protein
MASLLARWWHDNGGCVGLQHLLCALAGNHFCVHRLATSFVCALADDGFVVHGIVMALVVSAGDGFGARRMVTACCAGWRVVILVTQE